jgi:hypothetical protein
MSKGPIAHNNTIKHMQYCSDLQILTSVSIPVQSDIKKPSNSTIRRLFSSRQAGAAFVLAEPRSTNSSKAKPGAKVIKSQALWQRPCSEGFGRSVG